MKFFSKYFCAIFIISLSITSPQFSYSDTNVSGTIIHDVNWTLSGSPYIAGNVIVSNGVTLTIEPGVSVQFLSGASLTINGQLIAEGDGDNAILFTSYSSPQEFGDWGYINFTSTSIDASYDVNGEYQSGSILRNCRVEYGGSDGFGVIKIDSAHPHIQGCYIWHNSASGIYASDQNGVFKILQNTIYYNQDTTDGLGGGIELTNPSGNIIIDGNSISYNLASEQVGAVYGVGGGIYLKSFDPVIFTVNNNIIYHNSANAVPAFFGDASGGGIYCDAPSGDITITNNWINENSSVGDDDSQGGGLYLNSQSLTLVSNEIKNNTTIGTDGRGGGIYVYAGPDSEPVEIMGNDISENNSDLGGGMYIHSESPNLIQVYNNKIADNTTGGGICLNATPTASEIAIDSNLISGNSDGPGIYNMWNTPGIVSITKNMIMRNGANGIFCTSTTDQSSSSGPKTLDILNNFIVDNAHYGISTYSYWSNSVVNVENNTIENNVAGGISITRGFQSVTYNTIANNGSTGISTNAYMNGTQINSNNLLNPLSMYEICNSTWDVHAENNYWGTSVESEINNKIYDFYDTGGTNGIISYNPFLTSIESTAPIPSPTNVNLSIDGSDAIIISWDDLEVNDLSGYKIYWDEDGFPYENVIDVGPNTNYRLAGLTTGKEYFIAITSYDAQYDPSINDPNTFINENWTNGNESWFTSTSIFYSNLLAEFTSDIITGMPSTNVNFIDQSEGGILNYSWDFGDGSTSTEQNPSHIYTDLGYYTVTLTIEGFGGSDTETKTEYIKITETPTIFVPGNFPDIQSAINASEDGDTVLISNGQYSGALNTNLDFNGKAISVKSESGPIDCIIDCEGSSRGFYFHNYETNSSLLSGITIKNASQSAIFIYNSSPSIENCIIKENTGEGIYCNNSSSNIRGCSIFNNTGGRGGVELNQSSPIIDSCIIDSNSGDYGGILISNGSSPIVNNCTIIGNSSNYDGGGIASDSSSATISNCEIKENTSLSINGGGGFYSHYSNDIIENCIIVNNTAIGGNSKGGGIYFFNSLATIINNTISKNVSNFGGGVYLYSSSPTISNSIIHDNLSTYVNSPDNIALYNSAPTVTYSNIDGGYAGIGNINDNPFFISETDYHLQIGSSSIDAGDPQSIYSNEPDPNGCRVNIGAYGNTNESTISSDLDDDGSYGSCDGCPLDPEKIAPGICGCGVTEVDTDGDDTPDCIDPDDDNDGIIDNIENTIDCLDAYDADTDNDGIPDGVEDANQNGTVDAGETNPCLVDTDGDGIQDGTESGLTVSDVGPDTDLAVFVPDADPETTTNPTQADSDGDGVSDGSEDLNHNGRVDNGESDPNVIENTSNAAVMPWIPLLLLNENTLLLENVISNENLETDTHPSVYGLIYHENSIIIGDNTYPLSGIGYNFIDNTMVISQWFDSEWDNRVGLNPHFNTVYDNDGSAGPVDGIFEVVSATDESGTMRGTFNDHAYYFSYDGMDDWNAGAITLTEWVDHLLEVRNAYGEIGRLTIFCHGNYGLLHLSDNAILTSETISDSNHEHHTQLQRLRTENILSSDAHILLFSCLVAGNEDGQNFVNQIATLTDSTVHANTEYTGNPPSNVQLWYNYFTHTPGSDWDLDLVCNGESCWAD